MRRKIIVDLLFIPVSHKFGQTIAMKPELFDIVELLSNLPEYQLSIGGRTELLNFARSLYQQAR